MWSSCNFCPFYLKLEYVDVVRETSSVSCLMNVHSVVRELLRDGRQAYIVKLFYIFLQILLWMWQGLDYDEPTVEINFANLDERECQSKSKCMYLNRF